MNGGGGGFLRKSAPRTRLGAVVSRERLTGRPLAETTTTAAPPQWRVQSNKSGRPYEMMAVAAAVCRDKMTAAAAASLDICGHLRSTMSGREGAPAIDRLPGA
jgi:hypothetical protein